MRNNSGTLLTLLSVLVFVVATYFVVVAAGGVELSPDYSNTPNATVPGPPPFK